MNCIIIRALVVPYMFLVIQKVHVNANSYSLTSYSFLTILFLHLLITVLIQMTFRHCIVGTSGVLCAWNDASRW